MYGIKNVSGILNNLRLIRFLADDITKNLNMVLDVILRVLQKRKYLK